MRIWIAALATLMLARVVAAQPAPLPDAPSPPPPPQTSPPSPPPPEPPKPPEAPPAEAHDDDDNNAQPHHGRHHHERDEEPLRPTELSFGIGVGYSFPTSLQTPNLTSVRLRLRSGLTFEPQFAFATSSIDAPTGGSNKLDQLSFSSLVRYPIGQHHRVDLELVGGVTISQVTNDPNGANNTLDETDFQLSYGLAVAYWLSPHWAISLTATNPLITVMHARQDVGVNVETITDASTFGLVFDPQVTAMIHLYD